MHCTIHKNQHTQSLISPQNIAPFLHLAIILLANVL